MTSWLNLTMQYSASPFMEQLILFHNHALMILLMIITTVFYTVISINQNKHTSRFIPEGEMIENIWTIAPAVILVFTAIPSPRLLYLTDEIHIPVMTLKTFAHQWHWSYQYSDFTKLQFHSHIMTVKQLEGKRMHVGWKKWKCW